MQSKSKTARKKAKGLLHAGHPVEPLSPATIVLTREPGAALAGADPPREPNQWTDRVAHPAMGLDPSALAAAWTNWVTHLAAAPGNRVELAKQRGRTSNDLAQFCVRSAAATSPLPRIEHLLQDDRFRTEAWQQWPFNLVSQSFLLQEQWWHHAVTGMPGVAPQRKKLMAFLARQMLDVLSPSNFPLTNPEVLQTTLAERGLNLVRGARLFAEDIQRCSIQEKPAGLEALQVGRHLATTPGKVVFRNRLIELIQYAPTTDQVRPEPVLIVPAWLLKYYILDLSPHNSLVRFLTGQGFTVFMISWRNPGAEDRDLSMDDYRILGVMAAVDAVQGVTGSAHLHGLGYCLGGTILTIAASAMARLGDMRFKSLTILAAQSDFSDAEGELALLINDSQVTYVENLMRGQGYLSTDQMGGAFRRLRPADLIWSRNMRDYLMGQRIEMTDLLAWNADGTRLPRRVHSQYLRGLILNNDLAEGRYEVEGHPIAVSDIRAPIFVVGTEEDHVAPWKSVYKLHQLADTEITFVLTSGGHNSGIVPQPSHPMPHFRIASTPAAKLVRDADSWHADVEPQDGSWWTAYTDWLETHSGPVGSPPPVGNAKAGLAPLCDAPGTYVLQT